MSRFQIDLAALKNLPRAERDEVMRKLEQFQKLLERNPLWGYDPHPKQIEYHTATQPIVAFLGGNRAGKTTAGIAHDIIQAVDREALPPWLEPYKRHEEFYCRIVTPDLVATLEGVVLPKIRELVPREQLWKGSWEKAWDQRRRRLIFENGNWFDFLTHEMDLDRFSGAALHQVHFDEEPPGQKGRLIWQESLMRVIDYGGTTRITMTPLLGLSWSYHELTNKGVPRQDDEVYAVTVDMDDNPHLNQAAKERVLSGLSAEERAARKSGRFVHFAGLIYPEFDPGRHVIPALDVLPDDVEVFVGIDPGIRHMAGVVFCYLDAQDRLVVFDELPVQGETVAQVCARIHGRNERWGVRPRWYVIDPAARNKHHQTGRSDQMEYADHGIVAVPGQNARGAGFNRVKERLEAGRLLVTADCEVLVEQFREYRWKTSKAGESDPREEPVKHNDHLLDALRYVVMSRPVTPTDSDREPVMFREFRERMRWRRDRTAPLGAIFK